MLKHNMEGDATGREGNGGVDTDEKLAVKKKQQASNSANLVENEAEIEGNDGGDVGATDGGIGGRDEEMAAGGNEHEGGTDAGIGVNEHEEMGASGNEHEGRRPYVTTFIPPNVEDMHVMDEDYNSEELVSGESNVESDGKGKPVYEREIRFVKNDSVRCRVKCKNRCNFLALVSKVGGDQTYRMKTLIPRHTCGRVFNNKNAKSVWVAKKMVDKFRRGNGVSISEIIDEVISPINGQNKWPKTNNIHVMPHIFKAGPGRPKKLRRREVDEDPNPTKLKRSHTKYTCGRCQQGGHNIRKCPMPPPVVKETDEGVHGDSAATGDNQDISAAQGVHGDSAATGDNQDISAAQGVHGDSAATGDNQDISAAQGVHGDSATTGDNQDISVAQGVHGDSAATGDNQDTSAAQGVHGDSAATGDNQDISVAQGVHGDSAATGDNQDTSAAQGVHGDSAATGDNQDISVAQGVEGSQQPSSNPQPQTNRVHTRSSSRQGAPIQGGGSDNQPRNQLKGKQKAHSHQKDLESAPKKATTKDKAYLHQRKQLHLHNRKHPHPQLQQPRNRQNRKQKLLYLRRRSTTKGEVQHLLHTSSNHNHPPNLKVKSSYQGFQTFLLLT
ncbi:hypothetical protein SESBI_35938 [Sesbania bispinosa]|nr:hypothetical protein SESBI_35938 [Sesbania bispinosa]